MDVTHEDLVVLTAWLADRGHDAKTVAYAVEKPWKYTDELSLAKAVQEHEMAHPTQQHYCQESADGSGKWVCGPEWINGVEQFCDWEWTPEKVEA